MKRDQALADAERAIRAAHPERAEEILATIVSPEDTTIRDVLAFLREDKSEHLRVNIVPYGSSRSSRFTRGRPSQLYEISIERGAPAPKREPSLHENADEIHYRRHRHTERRR